jgi:hypothetical protein
MLASCLPHLGQHLVLLLLERLDHRRSSSSGCRPAGHLHRGSGEVARPARRRRRRPARPGRWPGLSRAARRCAALTRMTSSGVSWNTRLKPSGSTKRTVSRAACTASEMPSASCSVLSCRRKFHRIHLARLSVQRRRGRGVRRRLGAVGARRRHVDGQRQRGGQSRRRRPPDFVGRRRPGDPPAGPGARSRCRTTSSVMSSMAPSRTRTCAPRGRPSAPITGSTSGRCRRAPGCP